MQLNQAQIQKLSQELKLTPQQILQSTILQLTTLDLETRVVKELEQNPVLEETQDKTENEAEAEERDNETSEEEELDWEEIMPQNDDFKPKMEYDRSKETPKYVQPAPDGLNEHLFDQLKLLNLTDNEAHIAREIVWNINDKGYLTLPVENIASTLDVPADTVEKILKQIQNFEPTGIAARDLRECLLLQLREKQKEQDVNGAINDAITIVRDHFDDFANRRFQKLIKKLKWDRERILRVQEIITKLNPKPGASISSAEPRYVTPDLIVEKIGDEFIVEVNDSRVPELKINSSYLDMVAKKSTVDSETKSYLKKKVDMANWFIQAIHQRRITMIRVMKAIINHQREFFEDNSKPLKPMILKDIAEDVEMDISTISRVTNGKYVQLYSGVYELKYFFNEGMKNSSGEEVSTRIIKQKLQDIVDSEDKQNPHSDEKLAELLKETGYPVARRTVAKYRKQLKIPVARLRRNV